MPGIRNMSFEATKLTTLASAFDPSQIRHSQGPSLFQYQSFGTWRGCARKCHIFVWLVCTTNRNIRYRHKEETRRRSSSHSAHRDTTPEESGGVAEKLAPNKSPNDQQQHMLLRRKSTKNSLILYNSISSSSVDSQPSPQRKAMRRWFSLERLMFP